MIKPVNETPVRNSKPHILIVLVSLLAIAPALINGVPAARDLQHHFRLALAFRESISQGDFYPSWLAASNNGYGDVSLRFYPPGLAILLSLTRSVTGNWYSAALIVFLFLTLIGGLGTYKWATNFYPSRI